MNEPPPPQQNVPAVVLDQKASSLPPLIDPNAPAVAMDDEEKASPYLDLMVPAVAIDDGEISPMDLTNTSKDDDDESSPSSSPPPPPPPMDLMAPAVAVDDQSAPFVDTTEPPVEDEVSQVFHVDTFTSMESDAEPLGTRDVEQQESMDGKENGSAVSSPNEAASEKHDPPVDLMAPAVASDENVSTPSDDNPTTRETESSGIRLGEQSFVSDTFNQNVPAVALDDDLEPMDYPSSTVVLGEEVPKSSDEPTIVRSHITEPAVDPKTENTVLTEQSTPASPTVTEDEVMAKQSEMTTSDVHVDENQHGEFPVAGQIEGETTTDMISTPGVVTAQNPAVADEPPIEVGSTNVVPKNLATVKSWAEGDVSESSSNNLDGANSDLPRLWAATKAWAEKDGVTFEDLSSSSSSLINATVQSTSPLSSKSPVPETKPDKDAAPDARQVKDAVSPPEVTSAKDINFDALISQKERFAQRIAESRQRAVAVSEKKQGKPARSESQKPSEEKPKDAATLSEA